MNVGFKEAFYVMVFRSTMDTISTEKKLSQKFNTLIVPTPREISKSCGFAIRFYGADESELIYESEQIDVPHVLYLLGSRSNGKRKITVIESIE